MINRTLCPIILVIFILTSGCIFPEWEAGFDEVSRVSSPDGKVDAVLVETNGGATTSFGYRVFIATPGEKVDRR